MSVLGKSDDDSIHGILSSRPTCISRAAIWNGVYPDLSGISIAYDAPGTARSISSTAQWPRAAAR
eukprot:scaffold300820_cov31-Tisochrysis_lutea.AAC.1